MGFKKIVEKYRCNVCGNEVVMTKMGRGELVCCGKPIEKIEEENKREDKNTIKKENRDRLKILLVDDEPGLLELVGMRISGWGHDLITAVSGEKAISALIEKKPDIIILDYVLPDMDGITTLKKIRDIDEKVPVIMLTAHPSKDAMIWADKMGVRAFIPKCKTDSDMCDSLKETIDLIAEKK